jgi:hypothetical protein
MVGTDQSLLNDVKRTSLSCRRMIWLLLVVFYTICFCFRHVQTNYLTIGMSIGEAHRTRSSDPYSLPMLILFCTDAPSPIVMAHRTPQKIPRNIIKIFWRAKSGLHCLLALNKYDQIRHKLYFSIFFGPHLWGGGGG